MLQIDMEEKHERIIRIKYAAMQDVEELVDYIYSGKIAETYQRYRELLVLGDRYQVPELVEFCSHKIGKSLTKENVLEVGIFGDTHNSKTLVYLCAQFIDTNMNEAFSQEDLMERIKGSPNLTAEVIKNIKTSEVSNQLLNAAFDGNYWECRSLVERGANVNFKDNAGWTPVIRAAHWGRHGGEDIVKYLHQAGADINDRNMFGRTALMEAAERGNRDVVKYLHQAGADLNTRYMDGRTAVMMAAAAGHGYVVKYLHQAGADLYIRNGMGYYSVMKIAARDERNEDIVEYLRAVGAV